MRRKYSLLAFFVSFQLTSGLNSATKSSNEIIGSSVVTSVSVILGNGHDQSTKPMDLLASPSALTTTSLKAHENTEPIHVVTLEEERSFPHENYYQLGNFGFKDRHRKDNEGVQNVLQALKTIVKEEQQKQAQAASTAPPPTESTTKKPPKSTTPATTTNTNVVQSADESPPIDNGNRLVPGSAMSGEDDDEMESSGISGGGSAAHSTDAIDEFAKHVVSMQPVEQDADNDTATSAEVHDAIHKISGAILSVDDGMKSKKPIENIVTDVLSSINTARNTSDSHRPHPNPPTTAAPSRKPTTKKPSSTTKKPTVRTTTTRRPHTTTPSVNATTTTTKKPQTTTKKQNQNQLKTDMQVKAPVNPNKVELPMIIMLDESDKMNEKPQMSHHDKEMMALKNREKQKEELMALKKNQEMLEKQQQEQKQEQLEGAVDPQEQAEELEDDKPSDNSEQDDLNSPVQVSVQQSTSHQIINGERLPGLPVDDPFSEDGAQWVASQNDPNLPESSQPQPSPPNKIVIVNVNQDQNQQYQPDLQDQQSSSEEDQEPEPNHDQGGFGDDNNQAVIPVEYTTLRPYIAPPTKAPMNYFHGKRPHNDSTSSNRPNEFYDDEIFGYDPYQTFFHGVYVPVVEVGALTEIQNAEDSSEEYDEEYSRPKPRPKPHRRPSRPSASHNRRPPPPPPPQRHNPNREKKPVPNLPDHLHRPRPSHLQYQHGAADDTDPETGLLNAHYEHPGHSFGPDGDFITPDKLALHSRPALPVSVRKNFTDHHDHHVQHQHGIGGSGHGGHGGGHAGGGHDHAAAGGGHGLGGHSHGGEHGHVHPGDQTVSEKRPNFAPAPNGNPGLEATLTSLDEEKRLFVDINNRLALRMFSSLTNPVSKSGGSFGGMVISPFTATSSLGMLFLGARGQTAAQLDGLLQLDDMLTFNPHMMYHNVTESFLSQPNTAAAIIRLLVTDKEKGDVLEFYKTRVQHFYEARVEEVDYKFAGHLAQSIINQMIRAQIQRHSYEMLNYSLPLAGPMSLLTATFFDGQFAGGRDTSVDTMNFIHLAALQNSGPTGRRLFQVPAFALKGPLRAVYDKDIDATAVELPYTTRDLSLILVMPGKSGEFAIGGVTSLKSRMNLDAWTKLMRGFYPRDTFKVVLPRFRHQTSVNLSHTLNRFGLTDMFEPTLAKFKGINGLSDLHLDQNMIHFAEFGTWEKLSDTMNENNNRNLDLIRILRPHVREHYGNYGQDGMQSAKEQQRSSSGGTMVPDDVSRLRMELERLRRRPQNQNQNRYQSQNLQNPLNSYSKVSTSIEFRPRAMEENPWGRHHNKRGKGRRQGRSTSRRSKDDRRRSKYSYRQEQAQQQNGQEEQETVLRFERPFLYVLRHNPTGMILFMGQYTEPVQEILE